MIRKCGCGYTMQERCEKCGPTRTAHPPRFASTDRYGKYRRIAKSVQKKGK